MFIFEACDRGASVRGLRIWDFDPTLTSVLASLVCRCPDELLDVMADNATFILTIINPCTFSFKMFGIPQVCMYTQTLIYTFMWITCDVSLNTPIVYFINIILYDMILIIFVYNHLQSARLKIFISPIIWLRAYRVLRQNMFQHRIWWLLEHIVTKYELHCVLIWRM